MVGPVNIRKRFFGSRKSLTVTVVDVGHGNATVIRDSVKVTVIDAGSGGQLLEYLRTEAITRIQTVVISHADSDHVGGLLALLSSRTVRVDEIWFNSDGTKLSRVWRDLLYELDHLEQGKRVAVHIGLKAGDALPPAARGVSMSVLAPRTRLAGLSPGSLDAEGHRIKSNSVSAVLRVDVDGNPTILLPGDIDAVGYAHLIDGGPDLTARYLVLPHHGGLGGDPAATELMMRDLVDRVQPEQAFVSNGRSKFGNPRADVLRAVRGAVPGIKIACTQISRACGAPTKQAFNIFASGAATDSCCAGSIRLSRMNGIRTERDSFAHDLFVTRNAPSALCVPERASN